MTIEELRGLAWTTCLSSLRWWYRATNGALQRRQEKGGRQFCGWIGDSGRRQAQQECTKSSGACNGWHGGLRTCIGPGSSSVGSASEMVDGTTAALRQCQRNWTSPTRHRLPSDAVATTTPPDHDAAYRAPNAGTRGIFLSFHMRRGLAAISRCRRNIY